MKLSDTLSADRVVIGLKGADKEAIIRELVDVAAASGSLADKERYLQRVIDREFLLSTGIGYGVAVPHAQAPGIDGLFCCLGTSRDGVDYESIDSEPARIICLIAAEEGDDASYLLLLSVISRLFAQGHVRDRIRSAELPDEILAIIREAEELAEQRG